MKLLIALLLLVSTASYINWNLIRRDADTISVRREFLRANPKDDSEFDEPGRQFQLSLIDDGLKDTELNARQIELLETFLIRNLKKMRYPSGIGETRAGDGDLIRRKLKMPEGTRITFGILGNYISDFVQKVLPNVDRRDISNIQRRLFPDPSERLKLTGPLERFYASFRGDPLPSDITPGMLGRFFFGLLLDQSQFDTFTSVLSGVDRTIYGSSLGADTNVGLAELRLAELVISHAGPGVIRPFCDIESEKIYIAMYMKERVIPMWFADDYRQELCEMIGVTVVD